MKKYEVLVAVYPSEIWYVEAKDEEEAEEKALLGEGKLIGECYDSMEREVVDIETYDDEETQEVAAR